MAPEVISLLSSPEPEPGPRPKEAPQSSTTGLRGLAQQWDFAAVNLSSEGVERIPESLVPNRSATITRTPTATTTETRQEDFFFDSDDFDVTGDLGGGGDTDEQLFIDERPSKRRRLSKSPIGLPVGRPVERAASIPPWSSAILSSPPRKASKPTLAIDPIELSSSPVRPVQSKTCTINSLGDDILSSSIPQPGPQPQAIKTSAILLGDISDFSNPFASSSPLPPRAKLNQLDGSTAARVQAAIDAPHQHGYGSDVEEVDATNIRLPASIGLTDIQAREALEKTNSYAREMDWLSDELEDESCPKATGKGPSECYAQPKPGPSPRKSVAWDPISSSAPIPNGARSSPPARLVQRSRSEIICLDDSDEDPKPKQKSRSEAFTFEDSDLDLETVSTLPRSRPEAIQFIDSDSSDEFPDDLRKINSAKLGRSASGSTTVTKSKYTAASKAGASKPRATAAKKTPEELAREKIARESDKERAKLAREAERERKKQEKEQAKEQKALEKERAAALAEVNKIRTDKKTSTPEMLVDIPQTLPGNVKARVELLLKDLDVEFSPWASPVDNVVKWRRKVRARYNDELGHWEPIPMLVEPEKHVMVIVEAPKLVNLILAKGDGAEGETTLERHVTRMKRNFPDHTLVYLVQGLNGWMKENRNIRSRQFVSAVREGLPNGESATVTSAVATSRRKKQTAAAPKEYIDEDLIEDALLSLQVRHQVLIHHTNAALDTARQIAIFTQQLSTLPYKRVRDDLNAASAGFCMESGQVKVGDGPRDTYAKMLQEVNRVTAPIAYGIMGEFATAGALARGMAAGGPSRLEDVRKCVDREGTVVDDARRIGPSVSRRVWAIFTGRDERSMDV